MPLGRSAFPGGVSTKSDPRDNSRSLRIIYSERMFRNVVKPIVTFWRKPVLAAGLLLFLLSGRGWSADAAAAPKPGKGKTLDLGGGVKMEFVWCPPGEFVMGSPPSETGRFSDETPHWVTLTKGFYLGKFEVTQAQWERVMGANPSHYKGADLPVESVSWDDCQEFVKKLGSGARLPTEAEWEYACRAGTTTAWSFGNSVLDAGKYAWYGQWEWDGTKSVKVPGGNAEEKTHQVGQKLPNAWGLYDMHGNVWEWCADWDGAYPKGVVTNPPGAPADSNRVNRGGGWNFSAWFCRSANRYRGAPTLRDVSTGLRVAFTPPEE